LGPLESIVNVNRLTKKMLQKIGLFVNII